MVNLIMRVSGEETTTMSRSFLLKKYNYSHCPLKKRPVQFMKEEKFDDKDLSDDYSEPENLSTKPEDLSLSCKTLTPPPAVALISTTVKKENEEDLDAIARASSANIERAFGRVCSKSSGPLEPLNLNTASANHGYEATHPSSWPRAVPAHYPPHYIPLNYLYPTPQQTDVLPYCYYSSPSPPSRLAQEPPQCAYVSHDPCAAPSSSSSPPPLSSSSTSSSSPPRHAFAPFRSHRVPVIAAATLPHRPASSEPSLIYRTPPLPGEHSPLLSPTSTCSSNSYPPSYYADLSPPPPPVSPEDLSSPGSVGSNNGDSSSASSTSSKKRTRDPTPRYKCAFCSKSYSTFSGLSKHQQHHCTANEDAASRKIFKCKSCDKEYTSLGALKMHIRTHTLPCKCAQCGKAFSRPWLLQGHIRTHTGEKPFSCPHCNRAFADRSNLRAHLQTHSDVKKYSCPTCSKTFSRMSLLTKHADGGCPGASAGLVRLTDDAKSFYPPLRN